MEALAMPVSTSNIRSIKMDRAAKKDRNRMKSYQQKSVMGQMSFQQKTLKVAFKFFLLVSFYLNITFSTSQRLLDIMTFNLV